MFTVLPKNRIAAQKARSLSPLDLALLDLHVTAAFRRPDLYVALIDTATAFENGQIFEIFVVQLDVVHCYW
jgi:hypothetical protein